MMLPTKEEIKLYSELDTLKKGKDDKRIAEIEKRLSEIYAEERKDWPFA